jgi:hypothetical protein
VYKKLNTHTAPEKVTTTGSSSSNVSGRWPAVSCRPTAVVTAVEPVTINITAAREGRGAGLNSTALASANV